MGNVCTFLLILLNDLRTCLDVQATRPTKDKLVNRLNIIFILSSVVCQTENKKVNYNFQFLRPHSI